MSIIKAFNEHFEEFVTDIKRVFPNDLDIATAHNALLMLKKNNPKLILITFRDCVAKPYKEQIEKSDISFFINKDYNKDFNIEGETNSLIISKIDTLREPVSKMTKEEQNKVIEYIQNLTKLSELYV